MTTEEVERPAGLGRYCLREMQMEEVTHQAFLECLEALLLRKYKGQPLLPMWLPEYPPSDLPRLTSTEIPSPPIAPTSFSVTVTEKMIRPPRRPGFFNSFVWIPSGPPINEPAGFLFGELENYQT